MIYKLAYTYKFKLKTTQVHTVLEIEQQLFICYTPFISNSPVVLKYEYELNMNSMKIFASGSMNDEQVKIDYGSC